MTAFEKDNKWQREIRDRILVPGFYRRYSHNGRYVVLDKGRMATLIQRRFAADTVAQGKDGEAIFIEEKIARRSYTSFFLETESCTKPGHESDGWMKYGEADILLYAFAHTGEQLLDVYWIDFPRLKTWFWTTFEHYPYRPACGGTTPNGTMGRVVPISDIDRAVGLSRWLVSATAARRCGVDRP